MPKKTDKPLPRKEEWAIKVEKKMLDLRLSKSKLAEGLAEKYGYLCNVMNGWSHNEIIKSRIILFVNQLYREKFGGE